MKSSHEPSVLCAVRILEGVLTEVLVALEVIAREENWPWERTQDRVQGLHDPVDLLIKMANSSRRDASMEA